jgi:uncharacterized heparinase superfamily protein
MLEEQTSGISRSCWDGNAHRFVNVSHRWEGDWFPEDVPSRLWTFHLHYFDWLRQPELSNEEGLVFIRDWVSNVRGGDPWGPYPTSLRLFNWVRFLLSRRLRDVSIEHSLYLQAECLSRNLETHLLANHLWANAKALFVAGCFFEGERAEQWLSQGRALLLEQLTEQFLPDGGHIERSPMYHVILLEDCLDLLALLPSEDPLVPRLQQTAEQGLRFLAGCLPADGRLPLLGDTAWKQAPTPSELFEYARRLGFDVDSLPHRGFYFAEDSGIVRLEKGDWSLVARVGDIGVDWQPGHTHADAGSFELCHRKQRFVVDTGCGTYNPGDERSYMRSTPAHNTLALDGLNSSEVWASHRLGRRGHSLRSHAADHGEYQEAVFSHNGYAHLPGFPIHQRRFVLTEEGLRIEDLVDGVEKHLVQTFLHTIAEVSLSNEQEAHLSLEWDEDEENFQQEWRIECNLSSPQTHKSRWWPQFNLECPANTLTWTSEQQLPVNIVTTIGTKD